MPKKNCPFCKKDHISTIRTTKKFGKRRARIYHCPRCGILHYDFEKNQYVRGHYIMTFELTEKWRKEQNKNRLIARA